MLGIDLGARRIGLAVSDATGTVARPLKTIERGPSDQEAVTRLRASIDAANSDFGDTDTIGRIVIGLPTRLDGTPTDQTIHARKIAALLEEAAGLPVVLQDERLSSREAESHLSLREKDWRKRKARLDAVAAAVILQDYLDHHR